MNTAKKQDLGFHRKNKRLWINHGTITDAGLAANDPVSHVYDEQKSVLIIQRCDGGKFKVNDTHKGCVIDLNNKDFSNFFSDWNSVDVFSEEGRIVVKGHHAEDKIKEREHSVIRRVRAGEPLRKGGLFTGTGLLCRSVHRGLKKADVAVRQRFANEFNPLAAEVNLAGNEIWQDAFEDALFAIDDIYTFNMDIVPKLDILVMGSPCPAFSQLNTQMERDGKKDIFHPESGTIFQPILEVIRKSNPAVILLENSKFFKGSVFDFIMSDLMRRFGYEYSETVVSGTNFGDFEKRERLCRVWYSAGLSELNLENLPFQQQNNKPLKSILEPISDDDKRWARRPYLEAKDAQKHNGHKYNIASLDDTVVPTCGANYAKVQPDSLVLAHPSKEMVTRIMTPSEHCNLRDINGTLKENIVAVANGKHYSQQSSRPSATKAHAMLGNSVSPKPWLSVGYRIGEWLKSLCHDTGPFATSSSSQLVPDSTEDQLAFAF